MPTFEDFGRWVAKMGGQEGLAIAYEKELGKKVSQSAISGWFTSRKIPEARRPDLKALGWRGPWEWPKDPKEEQKAPGGGQLTRDDFLKAIGGLESKIRDLEGVVEDLAEGLYVAIPSMPPRSRRVVRTE